MNRSFNFGAFPKKIDSTTVIVDIIFRLASIGITRTSFSDIEDTFKKSMSDVENVEKEIEDAMLFASACNYIAYDNKEDVIITISKEEAIEKLKNNKVPVLVKKQKNK